MRRPSKGFGKVVCAPGILEDQAMALLIEQGVLWHYEVMEVS
jgi:hypothetical protein